MTIKTLLLTAAAVLCFTSALFAVSNEWTRMGGDICNTGYSNSTVLRPPFKIKWMKKFPGMTFGGSPLVAYGRVVLRDMGGGLFCFDTGTGAIQWRYYAKRLTAVNQNSSCIANPGGTPYVYSNFYRRAWPDSSGIHCMDLYTGELVWRKYSGYCINRSPALLVAQNRLFVISNFDSTRSTIFNVVNFKTVVQAFNAANGDRLWTYVLYRGGMTNIGLCANTAGDTIFASCGAANGNDSGATVALHASTGGVFWRLADCNRNISGYAGDLQYTNGRLLFPRSSGSAHMVLMPAGGGAAIYDNGGSDGYTKVSAISTDGKYWTRHWGAPPNVYNISDGKSFSTPQFNTGDCFSSGCSPTAGANGYTYIGYGNPGRTCDSVNVGGKKYMAWSESGGAPVWTFKIGNNACTGVAIAYDKLYLSATADGVLYCFENQ